ncbi:MAG: lysophospholipid acyltransferase family protein [Bryobacteraceae bacterium]
MSGPQTVTQTLSLPSPGSSGRVIRIRAEYAIAAALVGALRRLPMPLAGALSRVAVRVMDWGIPRLRRIAMQNLSFAFPQLDTAERKRIADGVFANIARLLVAFARFPSLHGGNIARWIGYEGLENYSQAKAKGRGILIATAHLGNWELSAFAHALLTEPMNVMVRPLDNPLIDRLVENRRKLSGNRLIVKRDAARPVLKALQHNEAVGVLMDQNTSASEGAFVNFFGKSACANPGLVKLAYRSGTPVVPGFALWDESRRRYVLRFYPEVALTGDAAADTQRIHSLLEEIIREHADQWMWIHRRWKTRPAGEEPLY